MPNKLSYAARFHRWRLRHLSERKFIILLSVVIGVIVGILATLLKNFVWKLQDLVNLVIEKNEGNSIYFILPIVGILLTVLFVRFIVRKPVRPGIPNVLHSISRRKGDLSRHNLYSSMVSSALTVSFGGSVGLEGPTVVSGAAYSSVLSRFFHLDYRSTILMLACSSAAAMAAIFKAPIAAIVFAVEVIMIDLTTFSLVPLLLSSSAAVMTSYFFMGHDVLYPFDVKSSFVVNDLPYYIALGILTGVVSAYFTKINIYITNRFEKIPGLWNRLLYGGLLLGFLIFLFPSLYGEGYLAINACLAGDYSYLYNNSVFFYLKDHFFLMVILLAAISLLKVVATSLAFGSGGVGGIFAPTLFTGVNVGAVFAVLVDRFGNQQIDKNNFALIGMAGLIAGVLHAPLTGIFLIADISGGYLLFVPLMITATFSFLTVKAFAPKSVYHAQLAQRRELMTHDKDKNILQMMEVKKLVETDFVTLHPDATLRDLTEAISTAHRNIFPVVDDEGYLKGMVKMDDIRHLIFKQELYDSVKVSELMYLPEHFISTADLMEQVVEKFEVTGRYNIAVIDEGRYIGFISRARVFSSYRKKMSHFSYE
ncbi:chloride channel protein [Mangrovibacterium diazotrophicum]|uniref:CIC family chloride channel protein n=1 Tax=Mangrovibacterium diazotrophicum TaxID=1261403 RepID=A0A419W5K4_9BACT|nr:chloride channel protein [Mangrovibacterium diazotrophicum]RKD90700.1 CIC family chloride channel protein [Mangrovibacterium diazotrophicum]